MLILSCHVIHVSFNLDTARCHVDLGSSWNQHNVTYVKAIIFFANLKLITQNATKIQLPWNFRGFGGFGGLGSWSIW